MSQPTLVETNPGNGQEYRPKRPRQTPLRLNDCRLLNGDKKPIFRTTEAARSLPLFDIVDQTFPIPPELCGNQRSACPGQCGLTGDAQVSAPTRLRGQSTTDQKPAQLTPPQLPWRRLFLRKSPAAMPAGNATRSRLTPPPAPSPERARAAFLPPGRAGRRRCACRRSRRSAARSLMSS